jgi:benzylsuccinate CoA-transferase BbsF subunit
MLEVLTAFLGEPILDYQVNKRLRRRIGNHDHIHAPHNVYRCAGNDSWVAIAVTSEPQWAALCNVLGRSEWLQDARFADPRSRYQSQHLLDNELSRWTAQQDRTHIAFTLQKAGVPAMPVLYSDELLQDEHLRAREFWQKTTRSEIGEHEHGMSWAHFSRTPIQLRSPAPLLGEHNELVLQGLLGLSSDTLEALATSQVIGNQPVGAPRL